MTFSLISTWLPSNHESLDIKPLPHKGGGEFLVLLSEQFYPRNRYLICVIREFIIFRELSLGSNRDQPFLLEELLSFRAQDEFQEGIGFSVRSAIEDKKEGPN